MHINSLSLIGDDSLILSSRETSSIIKISDIYGSPTVDYLISSDQFWEGTGYEDLLLEQVGDFTLQAGQHCVTYETSDELSDGQYYLTMYNNNNATISTRDYDYDSDENYDGTYSGTEGDESYYINILSMKLPEPLHLLTASLSPIPATSAPYSRLVTIF